MAPPLDIYGKSSLRCLTAIPSAWHQPNSSLELRPHLRLLLSYVIYTCELHLRQVCCFSVRRNTSRNARVDSNAINRTLARPPRLMHRGSESLRACLRPTDADLHSTRHRRRFCISWPTLPHPPVQSLADPQRVRVVSIPFIRYPHHSFHNAVPHARPLRHALREP